MALPDNRIRYPSTKIDFVNEVGTTGQDHDSYPAPLQQARFDHLRMTLIGLLSQQSSFSEPTQKREGTPWLDLNNGVLKIYLNGAWRPYSDAIQVASNADGTAYTLTDWYQYTSAALTLIEPEICFGGTITQDGVYSITIPESLQSKVSKFAQVFFYANGLLYDPRNISLVGSPFPSTILLQVAPPENSTYFVNIKRMPSSTFITTDVPQP
jgi:hypothetical protein